MSAHQPVGVAGRCVELLFAVGVEAMQGPERMGAGRRRSRAARRAQRLDRRAPDPVGQLVASPHTHAQDRVIEGRDQPHDVRGPQIGRRAQRRLVAPVPL